MDITKITSDWLCDGNPRREDNCDIGTQNILSSGGTTWPGWVATMWENLYFHMPYYFEYRFNRGLYLYDVHPETFTSN